jgi:glycerol-3-phosphate dehydrogenase
VEQAVFGRATQRLHPDRGTHIVLRRKLSPQAYLLSVPASRRIIFVLPFGDGTLVGTTETPVGAPEEFHVVPASDIDALIGHVAAFFPGAAVTRDDVAYAFAGARPLAAAEGRDVSRISRTHRIIEEGRVFTVVGGKYTTFRKIAEETVDRLAGHIPGPRKVGTSSITHYDCATWEDWDEGRRDCLRRCEELGIGPASAAHIADTYGSSYAPVCDLIAADASLAARLSPPLPHLCAEVVHAFRSEHAVRLEDVMLRRCNLAYTADAGLAAADTVARIALDHGFLTAAGAARQVEAYAEHVAGARAGSPAAT